jgi:hypothetical protein
MRGGTTAGTAVAECAALERQLETYPFARLSDNKGDQFEITLEDIEDPAAPPTWHVIGEPKPTDTDRSKVPGPFDADVYVAVCRLYNHLRRPGGDRTMTISYPQMAELMHRSPSGSFYDALSASLHRLARVSITASKWREGPKGRKEAKVRTFHVFEMAETSGKWEDDSPVVEAKIRFSEDVARSIDEGNFRLLDTGAYFALESPTAKRLYRYLSAAQWRGSERQTRLKLELMKLKRHLPIDRDAPSHLKATLDPAHHELIAKGFLERVDYLEEAVPGRKRPRIYVAYTFREPEALPTPAPAPATLRVAKTIYGDGRDEPDYLRRRVEELCQITGDYHSSGFYKLCAERFPEEHLNALVRDLADDLRSMKVHNRAKYFTHWAKRRAVAFGIDLTPRKP